MTDAATREDARRIVASHRNAFAPQRRREVRDVSRHEPAQTYRVDPPRPSRLARLRTWAHKALALALSEPAAAVYVTGVGALCVLDWAGVVSGTTNAACSIPLAGLFVLTYFRRGERRAAPAHRAPAQREGR